MTSRAPRGGTPLPRAATPLKLGDLGSAPVMRYLAGEAIRKDLALRYLRQMTVKIGGHVRTGVAMQNEADGQEVRGLAPNGDPFRSFTHQRRYTRIEGEGNRRVHVFAQAFDFLSYLALYDQIEPEGDAYILHIPRMVDPIKRAILSTHDPHHDERTAILWLGNTLEAARLTDDLLNHFTECGRAAATMNHLYRDFPSLHDWYKATRPEVMRGAAVKISYDTAWDMMRARANSQTTAKPPMGPIG